jgi:hypothetical protein
MNCLKCIAGYERQILKIEMYRSLKSGSKAIRELVASMAGIRESERVEMNWV